MPLTLSLRVTHPLGGWQYDLPLNSNISEMVKIIQSIQSMKEYSVSSLRILKLTDFSLLKPFLLVNTFHVTGLFLHALKKSESLWFSDVYRGYRKRPVTWNGLNKGNQLFRNSLNSIDLKKYFGWLIVINFLYFNGHISPVYLYIRGCLSE